MARAVGTEPGRTEPFFTGVVRVDAESGAVRVRDFGEELPGEPLFVPRPGGTREDDGWILVMTYVPGAHRSDLWVLDASDLGTVCRLELPHHVPPGFHGTFVAG